MSIIDLSESTYNIIPEGTYVFKIVSVKYKEDFGKLEVQMETKSGLKHTERFSLLRNDGTPNNSAMAAFSYFAKVAMRDFSLKRINHTDLVGHFIEADVEHDVRQSNKNPEKTVTFVQLSDKRESDGWEDDEEELPGAPAPAPAPEQKAAPVSAPAPAKPKLDLKALLG